MKRSQGKFVVASLVFLCVLIGSVLGDPSGHEARAAHMIKIGMKEEPKTLNIWLARDRWSLRVLSQIYQTLYYRDPKTQELIPWLAEEMPVFNSENLTYTVKLRALKWSDGWVWAWTISTLRPRRRTT